MMRNGFRLGRVFGIEITIDWSWIFIFLLITWQLAAAVFPTLHRNWGPGLCWGLAVIASLLFFASVLAHELAHSLVAKARGTDVRSITLFLFGGVSNIQREPSSAGSEFLITIVGPLTSIVLGIVFLLLAGVSAHEAGGAVGSPMQFFARLSPTTTLLFWLGQVNILVGLFNLVPAFPLDGGRVLRSLLWAVSHDLRQSTRVAATVGQIIAWIMIWCGIAMIFGARLPILGTGFIGGIWLAFIGWFLNNAAIASYQQVVIEDILKGVPVEKLMRAQAPAASAHLSVSNLVHDYLMQTDEEAFPVAEGDHLEGVVSLEDVRHLSRDAWDSTEVSQIMTPVDRLEVVAPRTDSSEAMLKMARRDVHQIPVVENGHLVGMLRLRDIARWLQLHSDGLRPV